MAITQTVVSQQAEFTAFRHQHPLRRCEVHGQTWDYIDSGRGEALLLLPGFFGVADTCFLYVLAFERDFRTIALTYPETAATIDELVTGLAAFMDRLGLVRAHVLGGSYSGYVAQVLVRRYP